MTIDIVLIYIAKVKHFFELSKYLEMYLYNFVNIV